MGYFLAGNNSILLLVIILILLFASMQNNHLENAKQFNSSPYERMQNASPYEPIRNAPISQPDGNYSQPQNPNFPHSHVPNYGFPQQGALPARNTIEDYASDINKLKRQQSSIHCQALTATLLLLAGQATGIVLYFYSSVNLSTGGLLGICIGSYVLYLIVACCCNPLSSYLGNIAAGQTFERYYESLRNTAGHFVFHAVCYHYETTHHTRTVTDSNGETRHQTYTTTEKVVTHSATEQLHPAHTKDDSGAIDQIRAETTIIFVHYFVNHRFANSQSEMQFNSAFQNFKFRNTRDAHQDFSYKYELPGLIERKAYFIGRLACDYGCWFYIFGAIGLLWPYSLWVESKISRFRVDTMKVLTM